MFSLKKPTIIIILIVLLVVTGYINHNLTLKASSKVSNEYQKHEEMELTKKLDGNDKELVEAISEGKEDDDIDDIEILDTKDENVDKISKEANSNISQAISKEDSLRSKNYFIEQRLSRDKLRAGLIDRLNSIVENEKTSEDVRTEAQKKIMSIGDMAEKELTIEGLIKAKGFEEALVFITEENAKIVVSKDELTEQDVVKILDIVMGETNLDSSNIKIMKKN